MNKQKNQAFLFMLGITVFVCAVVAVIATARDDRYKTVSLQAATNDDMATPTIIIHDTSNILRDASSQQVGQYVIKEFAPGDLDPHGTIELVLARSITRNEMPALGLGCMHDFSSIEDPPLMLVILKGDFADAGPSSVNSIKRYKYAGYIIDVWAAWPTRLTLSPNGGFFRKVLNDSNLPIEGPEPPTDCPPRTPGKLPYGAEVPGIVFPTPLLESTPTNEPVLPPPVPTASTDKP